MREIYDHCLSAIMTDADAFHASVSEGLTVEAFEEPRDQTIFTAVKLAAAQDNVVDVGTVWGRLQELKSGVSIIDLQQITSFVPSSAARKVMVGKVIGQHRQRMLTMHLQQAVEAAKRGASDFETLWAEVEPHLHAASEAGISKKRRTWADMCREAIRQETEPDARPIVKTGIAGFEQDYSPVRAGQLIALAARPGNGKTALALQLAEYGTRDGKAVAFFSLEMAGEDLATRLALQMAGADAAGDHPRAVEMRVKALERLAKIPNLDVTDMAETTQFSAIEARCRLLAAKPRGLGLVVIDYLQLITPPSESAKAVREQQIAAMTRRLKLMAGQLKVPVLLLCQLNRESEKEQREPRLSDLRESGSIEQDSDRVWFLHPFVDKDGLSPQPGAARIPVLLIQAKCRGGPPNIARKMIFDRPIYRFTRAA